VKVIPLAFDSLGVRSMATLVETDQRIIIDPGLDLAPLRYGLPPSEIERKRAKELSDKITEHARETNIFVITHYHHDHYFPEASFYDGRIVLLKHPENNINFNQRRRAKLFLKLFKNKVKKIQYADGREFRLSETTIRFSSPVPHGEVFSKSGFVVMCSISHAGEKFVFASDTQGPQVKEVVEWVVSENPDMLIISGYPTYLTQKANPRVFQECTQNLIEILVRTNVKTVILDHHLTRDLEYEEEISELVQKAQSMGKRVMTAAEHLGLEPDLLEARRKEIYKLESENM